MIEPHRLPPHLDRSALQAEGEPVKTKRPSDWYGNLSAIVVGRSNLLDLWPEHAYRVQTMSFKMVNQPYFLCNSPDSVRQVFLDKHDQYDRKSPQMRRALEPLLGDGLFVSDGALWKERRAYCAPAFESELLPDFASVMTEAAHELAEHWAALPAGAEVDVLNEMARLTARIIGRTIFGDDTGDDDAAQVVQGFSEYQKSIEQMRIAESFGLPSMGWLSNPLQHWRTRDSSIKVHEVIDRIIERQRANPPSGRFTLMSMFLEGKGAAAGGCPLGATAARNEAIVMFMAGHETTANTLAWAWYLLDRSPRVREALQHELDTVLQGRAPTLDDVPRLPYVRAVFEETLRLYPPVPVLSRQARSEDTIRGKPVAKDCIMLVVPWLLHRHTLYWEMPDHFIPERFMPGHPRPDKFIYVPFSVGHRVCLGLRFGLTEGILCLATLAQRFEVHIAPQHTVDIDCRLTLRPKGGLPVRLIPRTPCTG